MMHIRFNGESCDVLESRLGLGNGATDSDIREAVARYLELGRDEAQTLVVDRTPDGSLLVRPEAVFG